MNIDETGKMEGGRRTRNFLRRSVSDVPLISVVTVVRNGADHLKEALESVLACDCPELEYIVVDGGSTDATLDIIRAHDDRIDYWISEPDSGIYDAMNKGINLAQGELIAFLNSDDFYAQNAVHSVLRTWLSAGSPKGIVYGDTRVLREDLGISYHKKASLEFWRGMPVCHQSMFVHRQLFDRLGAFDTQYRLAADFDFLLRAVRADVPLLRVDQQLVTFRTCGQSVDSPVLLLQENRKIILCHFGLFSVVFLKFALRCCRDMSLLKLRNLLQPLLGERSMLALSRLYTRLFISKG